MPLCEMCGKDERLVLAEIEGGELNVCSNCVKYGTVKKKVELKQFRSGFQQRPTPDRPQYKIVSNYAVLIRGSREKKGMKQEEFAKFLNERESIVSKWEQGHLIPRIDVARRIGKILGINLVELETEGEKVEVKKGKSNEFTLGDFVKMRKRK
ncbi:MAG: TIGR00270 family protein [Nanoarchaeota archaeon]|nr:TIGR00270 family protein [Nanoarchaeota archaeon]MBU1623233.1 TIGR00270 family protein [Nanoarchaeota archaeon]